MNNAIKPLNNVKNIRNDYLAIKIDNFLNDKLTRSINTYKNYKIDINQFFMFFFDHDYTLATSEKLEKIDADDIVAYRNSLVKDGKAHTTVNRKIVSVKKLYSYLEASNPNIRTAIFNVADKLKENETNSYGVLTWEEAQTMMQLAKEKKDGEKFSLLLELAIKTCYRLTALITLTPNHIHQVEQNGQKYNVIRIIDKGQKHEKPISEDVYNRLMHFVNTKDDVFFDYSVHTVGRRFNILVEEMQLDERRNIKFHSLKKCGINFVFDSTGNIMLAQKQGNHKSASTTMKSYLEHNVDYSQMPSYTMGDTIDLEPLKELTKDQLFELIENVSSGTQLELLRTLKNIQENVSK